MTDYITLTVNEDIIMYLFNIFIIVMIGFVIFLYADLISRVFEENRKFKRKKICQPYRDHYEKLGKEGKIEEMRAYAIKYGSYVFDDAVKGYYD